MRWLATKPIVNDAVDGLIGLALIGGLFLAYYVERRSTRLRREQAERITALPPAIAEAPSPSGPSPSFAISFIYTALLIAAATHADSGWGYLWLALFGILFIFALRSTFGRGDYESARTNAPTLTRREHVLMNGIPYVLLPLIGFVLVIPYGWIWGAVVPGVIWLVPLGAGIALETFEAIRGRKR